MPAPRRPKATAFAPVLQSAPMRQVDSIVRAVASKEVTVTLIGESGTGKEILARRVHDLSARRKGPFIPINCAAIPDALFESELFGHERGAFTGANVRARGKVEAATGGTLFLDEIGELPLAMQAKLLRFLENRRYMRVGGSSKVDADVRLVFATLRPLAQEVQAGRFREDLYYRVQGITIVVPPLRERRADIPPLVAQFLDELSSRHGTEPPRLTRSARAALLAYAWPGNVRELRNTVELICLLRAGRRVRVEDLPADVRQAASDDASLVGAEPTAAAAMTVSLDEPLERIVGQVIRAALRLEQGNRAKAAARLGVSLRTVQRYIAREGSHEEPR